MKDLAFREIATSLRDGSAITEYDIQQRMARAFKDEGLIADAPPMVAAMENAGDPHYMPTRERSRPIYRQTNRSTDRCVSVAFRSTEMRMESVGWRKSVAATKVVGGGSNGSSGALEIAGTADARLPFGWSGVMLAPAPTARLTKSTALGTMAHG